MTSDRDPGLQSLFDAAEQKLIDADFVGQVVERMDRRRRQLLIGRVLVIAAIIVLEIVLESPFRSSMGLFVETLAQDLFPTGDGWLGFILAPLNSLAGLVGMALLGLNLLIRRIVH